MTQGIEGLNSWVLKLHKCPPVTWLPLLSISQPQEFIPVHGNECWLKIEIYISISECVIGFQCWMLSVHMWRRCVLLWYHCLFLLLNVRDKFLLNKIMEAMITNPHRIPWEDICERRTKFLPITAEEIKTWSFMNYIHISVTVQHHFSSDVIHHMTYDD